MAEVIDQTFGVRYHPDHVWYILRSLGWSCQKPERRARKRNEQAIQRWQQQDWPRIKKTRRQRYSIVFPDESGFMLQPVRRRTWAPTGKTPIQYSWDRHDRLSVISAITVSPQRRRLGLYFQIHPNNIRSEQMVPFLSSLHRALGRKFILVLDRYSVHRKSVRLL